MQLREVLAAVSRNWIVVVVTFVLALGAGGAVTAITPATYETEAKVLVRPTGTETVSLSDAAGLVADQVSTFAALAETPTVLDPAISASGVETTSFDLVDSVSAAELPSTTIIAIEVTAGSGQDAAVLAGAIADSLIDQIEAQTSIGGQSTTTGVVVEEPIIPTSSTGPNLLLNLVIAGGVGLLVAVGVVVARQALVAGRRRHA